MRRNISYRICFLFLMIALLRFPSSTTGFETVSQENDSITVEEVLNRYVEACGGAALEKIQSETRTGTLLRYISGQVPLSIISEAPGKWYYNQLFAWGDQISYGFDGKTAWIQTTGSIGDMDSEQLLDMQLLFDVRAQLKLKEFYPEMFLKGTKLVGEKEFVVIAAKSIQGVDTELAFDKETGFLVRAGDIFFEDYRDVGLVKRPFRILLGLNQGEEHRQMKMQFTEILHNQVIDDSIFEVPSCVLPVADAPLFKKRKQFEPSIEALDRCVGIYQHSEREDIKFRIFREENHLFMEFTGRGLKIEIIPESEVDYYTKFLGWDFHFVIGESEEVKEMIVSANVTIRAIRVN